MYKVCVRESETFPKETFTLSYDVDFEGDNSEWRDCVNDVLTRLRKDYEINEVDVPEFVKREDFVDLKYSIDGKSLEFSCDFLLYSIYITTSDESLSNILSHKLAGC